MSRPRKNGKLFVFYIDPAEEWWVGRNAFAVAREYNKALHADCVSERVTADDIRCVPDVELDKLHYNDQESDPPMRRTFREQLRRDGWPIGLFAAVNY